MPGSFLALRYLNLGYSVLTGQPRFEGAPRTELRIIDLSGSSLSDAILQLPVGFGGMAEANVLNVVHVLPAIMVSISWTACKNKSFQGLKQLNVCYPTLYHQHVFYVCSMP